MSPPSHEHSLQASQRAVLEFLSQQQAQIVPQIAREISVSRQHIQTVVNDLLALGLIEAVENPTHKRSSLIQLTNADTLRGVRSLCFGYSFFRLRSQELEQVSIVTLAVDAHLK